MHTFAFWPSPQNPTITKIWAEMCSKKSRVAPLFFLKPSLMLRPIYIGITICLNYLTKVLSRIYFLFYTVSSWYDIRNHVNTMPILQVNSRSSVKVFSRLDIWILVKTPPILQFSSWCLVGHIYPDGDDVRLETISICSFYESFIKTWQQEPCQDTHVIQVSSWCLGEHGHSWGTSSWC